MINSLRPYSKILYPDYKGFLRRISVIQDKELKNRPICIFDYWSQSALLPLHNSLMELLKKLSTDATFNQDAKLVPRPSGDSFYYSLDLSSATDRFPVLLQEKILGLLIGEEKAGAWKVIMTNYPAHSTEGPIFYKVGQPMGAYSSWATFTLCHHLIVQLSAKRSGYTGWFNGYCILGDDIVISNSDVAFHYQEIIKSLGVEISNSKSHVSKDTYEFAKR